MMFKNPKQRQAFFAALKNRQKNQQPGIDSKPSKTIQAPPIKKFKSEVAPKPLKSVAQEIDAKVPTFKKIKKLLKVK